MYAVCPESDHSCRNLVINKNLYVNVQELNCNSYCSRESDMNLVVLSQ
jgi:hypothetical protein